MQKSISITPTKSEPHAEISYSEATFLDTRIYKGKLFNEMGFLDVSTDFEQTEEFQYTQSLQILLSARSYKKV